MAEWKFETHTFNDLTVRIAMVDTPHGVVAMESMVGHAIPMRVQERVLALCMLHPEARHVMLGQATPTFELTFEWMATAYRSNYDDRGCVSVTEETVFTSQL